MTPDVDIRSMHLADVLERVLDKGIVIDVVVRVSVIGIDLLTVDARIIVASIQTYLEYRDGVEPESEGPPGVDAWAGGAWRWWPAPPN